MEPGSSVLYLQGLSSNACPEPNQSNSSYYYFRFILRRLSLPNRHFFVHLSVTIFFNMVYFVLDTCPAHPMLIEVKYSWKTGFKKHIKNYLEIRVLKEFILSL